MAEAAITAVINKTVEIAGNLVTETGSRIYHLQENVSWIERQMRSLRSYLKDAESKKANSHEVANLIITIRDLAQDVEDILDTYLAEIESHNTKGRFQFLKCASSALCYGVKANNFALEIEKIKKRAAELEVSRVNCGIEVDANAGAGTDADLWHSRKLFLRAPHESKIFGRERILEKQEVEMLREDKGSIIISVVGPAGVGKTTVAKRSYRKVKNEFEVSAIVYVSQEPRLGELLLDIAKQVGLSEDKMKENLEYNLYLLLQEKRYVILLDDIWDVKTWDSLRYIFPSNSENGSRIIVTSRYVDVGRYISGEGSLIQLNLLDKDEGTELFFDLILPTSEESLPPAVKDIGEKIVERCGGLPLAIVVAVGLLRARERSKHAWSQVLQSMSKGSENDCSKILALSYLDLPRVKTSLPLRWNVPRRSLCIQVAEDNNFFCTLGNLGSVGFASIVRRVTSNSCGSSEHASRYIRTPKKTHALLFFGEDNKELFRFMKRNTTDLTFLPILIIENEGEGIHLPSEITNLSGLSYLRLRGTFRAIPSGIGRLKSLVTLEITVSVKFGALVPTSILRMKYLKHLVLRSFRIDHLGVYLKRRSCPMDRVKVALQNLETLEFNNVDWYLTPSSFKKLSNLRKLCIFSADRQTFEILSDTTPLLQKLEDLKMQHYNFGTAHMPRLDLSRYQYMVKLHIWFDTGISITSTILFPPNLVKITLEAIGILGDPMQSLKRLAKLEIIKLKHCTVRNLDFSGEHSFPQLQ
ncbi:ToMV resistance protein Tm-2(2) [Sesamum alatum]|uniref:ToMV resistance protein Tm-2(2) n=1 Tax=Sesamum alatum TaxID=300844 RepID=A0AAE1XNE5_9LAMI|nr:ToMV resistance protein Tm-2(2) [Sesamum alatum]